MQVIQELRVWGFGNFMFFWQGGAGEYSNLLKIIEEGSFPKKERITSLAERISDKMAEFDYKYLTSLPLQPVNPLRLEQNAWRLLTFQIKEYLEGFMTYSRTYSPDNANKETLVGYLNKADALLKQWDVIGHSFSAKYDKLWDKIDEKEDAVRKLIVELDPIRGWYVQSFQALLDAADEMGPNAPYLERDFIKGEIERAKQAISYGETPIPHDPYDFVCGGSSSVRIVPQYSRDFVRIIAGNSISEQDEFWQKVSSKLNFPHMINDDGRKYVIEKNVPEGKV